MSIKGLFIVTVVFCIAMMMLGALCHLPTLTTAAFLGLMIVIVTDVILCILKKKR